MNGKIKIDFKPYHSPTQMKKFEVTIPTANIGRRLVLVFLAPHFLPVRPS